MTTHKPQLIKDCIKGRRKAYEAFYDLYRSKLFGICLRYAKNSDDAKDILQESFIKIFKQLSKLEDPNALDGWVKKVTIRTAINYYHRSIKNNFMVDTDKLEIQSEDYDRIISGITNEELVACINGLPEGYRAVFNMYVIDGFSHKEIADHFDISENTSKSQLRSAKLKLKEMLDKIGVKRYEKAI